MDNMAVEHGELKYKEAYFVSCNGMVLLIEELERRIALCAEDTSETIYFLWLLAVLKNITDRAETVATDEDEERGCHHLELVK